MSSVTASLHVQHRAAAGAAAAAAAVAVKLFSTPPYTADIKHESRVQRDVSQQTFDVFNVVQYVLGH